jgi:hypothetical protein
MAKQRIRGVALIVQNLNGEILVLQEYETKLRLGKRCGMFSIPMETSKPNEPDYNAIVRLLEEELPGFDVPLKTLSHVGIYRITSNVWVNLYSAKAESANLSHLENAKSREVGNHQWIKLKEVFDLWLRRGAQEMVSDFTRNKKNIFRKHCRIPDLSY